MINIQETSPSCRRLLSFSSVTRPHPVSDGESMSPETGQPLSQHNDTRKKRFKYVRVGQVFETKTHTQPRNSVSVLKYDRRPCLRDVWTFRFCGTLVRVYRYFPRSRMRLVLWRYYHYRIRKDGMNCNSSVSNPEKLGKMFCRDHVVLAHATPPPRPCHRKRSTEGDYKRFFLIE